MAKRLGYVETSWDVAAMCRTQSRELECPTVWRACCRHTPIQGSAADMMKKAMIEVQAALDAVNTDAKILLQVHDELLLELPEHEGGRCMHPRCRSDRARLNSVLIVAEWGVGRELVRLQKLVRLNLSMFGRVVRGALSPPHVVTLIPWVRSAIGGCSRLDEVPIRTPEPRE